MNNSFNTDDESRNVNNKYSPGLPIGTYKDALTPDLFERIESDKDRFFKVYLIDSDTKQRARLSRIILSIGFHVEIFSNLEEFLEYNIDEGVIFISNSIDSRGILYVMESLRKAQFEIPVVAYRENPSTDDIISAMRARVSNFLPIEFFDIGLRDVLDSAIDDYNQNYDRRAQLEKARKRFFALTRRERQVIDGMAEGLTNKEMARQLGISPRTVEIHRMRMLAKMNARSSSEAIKMWCSLMMN